MRNASERVLGDFLNPGDFALDRISDMGNDKVELLRLGRRIQVERKRLGFSQNAFSADCGLNRSYFGGIERGERNLTFAVLCKICNGLHCDIANVTRGIPRNSYRTPDWQLPLTQIPGQPLLDESSPVKTHRVRLVDS